MISLPKHPVSERGACWFHLACAAVGALHTFVGVKSSSRSLAAAHVAGGVGMLFFHGVSAYRHYRDIGNDVH